MKRLSNKKYKWNKILTVLVWALIFTPLFLLLIGCQTPKTAQTTDSMPFCQEWNTMGDMDGGEPVTPKQRRMFHLGYFLTKSDFVRTTLNQHFGEDNDLVDRSVTCYEENAMYLVEQVDDICKCSEEDKKDEVISALNKYVNECVREAGRETKREK